jgi:hypothetical protein
LKQSLKDLYKVYPKSNALRQLESRSTVTFDCSFVLCTEVPDWYCNEVPDWYCDEDHDQDQEVSQGCLWTSMISPTDARRTTFRLHQPEIAVDPPQERQSIVAPPVIDPPHPAHRLPHLSSVTTTVTELFHQEGAAHGASLRTRTTSTNFFRWQNASPKRAKSTDGNVHLDCEPRL